jgi:hypothetical protein
MTNLLYLADEATSALDATSHILVFEAMQHWRSGKTTIVITRGLSQISSGDFLHVLKSGRVIEKGYRADLEIGGGTFSEMIKSRALWSYLPEKDLGPLEPILFIGMPVCVISGAIDSHLLLPPFSATLRGLHRCDKRFHHQPIWCHCSRDYRCRRSSVEF